MGIEKYSDLLMYIRPEYKVPEVFFENSEDDTSCIFLVSCLATDRVLYMEDSCEMLTGYLPEKFLKKGMDFWFHLIHSEDLPGVTEKIIRSHEELFKPGFTREQLSPLVLEYRFRRPDGEWWKIKDTKYLLLPDNEIVIDKILCKFELISSKQEKAPLAEEILQRKKSCTKMLEFALVHNHAQTKQLLDANVVAPKDDTSSVAPQLTKREKEILLLIGQGFSTKMIADKCNISINTVETHRRHLLEKLQVKNSMELIKAASKVFWL